MSFVTKYQFVASFNVKSGAGVGFKKWAYHALKMARRLRMKDDGRWVEVEKVAFRHIDCLIEIEAMEAANKIRAALRQDRETEQHPEV